MKYLVLLAVLALGYALWRSKRPRQPPPAHRTQRSTAPQDMVACAHCGVHLPRTEALQQGGHHYCCAEHQQHNAR